MTIGETRVYLSYRVNKRKPGVNKMKIRFKIGQKFKRHYKRYEEEVTDILTTTNSKGEIVSIRYVAKHDFCGQCVLDRDVTDTAIARGIPNLNEILNQN